MTKSTLKKIVGIGVKNEDLRTVCKLRLAQVAVGDAWQYADDVDCDDSRKDIVAQALRAVDRALKAYGMEAKEFRIELPSRSAIEGFCKCEHCIERDRDAALARATAAEKERDTWKTSMDDLAQSARENERRAEAAEAREAGLREALARIRAFARPIWSDARCGDEMKPINADCLDDICDMVDAALAAPAKEVKP